MILGKTAYVVSEDAHTGAPIGTTVTPDRVEAVAPRLDQETSRHSAAVA